VKQQAGKARPAFVRRAFFGFGDTQDADRRFFPEHIEHSGSDGMPAAQTTTGLAQFPLKESIVRQR